MSIKIEPSQKLDKKETNSGGKNWFHFAKQILKKTQPSSLVKKWKLSKKLTSKDSGHKNKSSNQPKTKNCQFRSRIPIILDHCPECFEVIEFFYKMTESPLDYLSHNGSEVIEFKTDKSRSTFLEKCQKNHNWLRDEIFERTEAGYSISEEQKEEVIYDFLQNSNVNGNLQTIIKIEEEEEKKEKTPTFEKIHQCQCDKKFEIVNEKLDLILQILIPSNSGGNFETNFERKK